MKSFLIILTTIFLFPTEPVFAGDSYGSCYVANGEAHAQFCSDTSDSDSGVGSIKVYDQSGRVIETDNIVIWIGIAIMGCDEVETMSVDDDAVSCSFQLEN